MKLWHDGYFWKNCRPSKKCDTCKLRFKCYTSSRLEFNRYSTERGDVDKKEVAIFIQMARE